MTRFLSLKPRQARRHRANGEPVGQAFYYVHGGTVELTGADGKKQTFQRKTGAARIVTEKGAFSAMNVGKTTIHVIAFSLK